MNSISPGAAARKLATALILSGVLAACNHGSGPMVADDVVPDATATYEPTETMQALRDKITVDGLDALLLEGVPPPSTPESPVTIVAPTEVVSVDPGNKISVPLVVSAPGALDALFAKIPGASAYFLADLRIEGKREAGVSPAKLDRSLSFEVDVPSDLAPGGVLCFEFSAQAANGEVSNVAATCLQITAAATPTPSATATPTATSTTTAGPSPSPASTPTATPTATASATPTPTPTATATSTPGPTPTATASQSPNCTAPSRLSWSGDGTDSSGAPVSVDVVDTPSVFLLTNTTGQGQVETKFGGASENSDEAIGPALATEITGTGQYTAGASSASSCGYGTLQGGQSTYNWAQESLVVNVSVFETCPDDIAYLEFTFSCSGLDGDSTGAYRGIRLDARQKLRLEALQEAVNFRAEMEAARARQERRR